jgi:hypothetical protein
MRWTMIHYALIVTEQGAFLGLELLPNESSKRETTCDDQLESGAGA